MSILRTALIPIAALTLSACGGGGGGTVDTSTQNPPTNPPTTTPTTPDPGVASYETFSSTESVTSTLDGVALLVAQNAANPVVVTGTGSLTHNTGATTIDLTQVSFTDADGLAGGTTLSNGPGTALTLTGLSTGLDYVQVYDGSITSSTNQQFTVDAAIVGIVTDPADITTTNTVTYAGGAEALLIVTSGQSAVLQDGTSSVSVNFNTNAVNVALDNFTARDPNTGGLVTAPLTDIRIANMTLSGARFSGGTLQLLQNGATVDLLGTNSSTSAAGAVFGLDSTNQDRPDELGGVFLGAGDSGQIDGSFVAD
ncbi:MAG: hypothetical protein AAGD04_11510 [Pseudomonadota bacterium]